MFSKIIGKSPLHIACELNRPRTVEYLICPDNSKTEEKADKNEIKAANVNLCDKTTDTKYPPLIGAIRNNNFPCVQVLCKDGIELEILEHNALFEAVKCGDTRIWQILVNRVFKMKEIHCFKDLHESQIFSSEKWHKMTTNASLAVSNLLKNINTCYKAKNFPLLRALLGLFVLLSLFCVFLFLFVICTVPSFYDQKQILRSKRWQFGTSKNSSKTQRNAARCNDCLKTD